MTEKDVLAVRIGRWSAAHRRSAVAGWLLLVVLTSVLGSMVGSRQTTDLDNGVGESGRALRTLAAAGLTPPAAESVFLHSGTLTAMDPAFRAAVADVQAALTGTGRATDVRSPYPNHAVSADGHSALVAFTVPGDPATADRRVGPLLAAVDRVAAAHPGLTVVEYGAASSTAAYNRAFDADFSRAEWTAVPLAIGILLVVFGALLAALLPVTLALAAFLGAYGLVALCSPLVHTSDDASSVMLLVGLAVGVDYCLFYLRRERDERAAGHSLDASLRTAAATSGHSVLVSGLTVVVAMTGMFLTGIADFRAIGLATILVVLVAVTGSVTVLPALLSMLGDRVEKGRIPLLRRRSGARASAAADGYGGAGRLWRGVLRVVLGHSVAFAVLATAVLLALAVPVLGMHTSQLTAEQELPAGNPVVRTGETIARAFPGSPQPAQVVVRAPGVGGPAYAAAYSAFTRAALATGRVEQPITAAVYPDRSVALINVRLAGDGTDAASVAALGALRGQVIPATLGTLPGARVDVAGTTAASVDFNARLHRAVGPVFGFVLGLAFVLMLVTFASLTLAVVTVVLNLLSVGAAYGVLTLVFQDGYGVSLLGGRSVGAVASWLPLFLFVILFGLSMDYHVFVVSRIKEEHDAGSDTRTAIARGVGGTAGVVSSAAVIMVGVFAIFGTLPVTSLKQLGIGLAVAVLLDATIIRGVLLPAVLHALGERTWYLPGPLRGLRDRRVGAVRPTGWGGGAVPARSRPGRAPAGEPDPGR